MTGQPGDNSVNKEQLSSIVERVERIQAQMNELSDDRSDIYKEAGGNGYDVKTLRKVIALRKMDAADRSEQESILESYLHALGMSA